MRWLILLLALMNLGFFAWTWHDGRLDPDPYAGVPPLERDRGGVELLDVRLERPVAEAAESGDGAERDSSW